MSPFVFRMKRPNRKRPTASGDYLVTPTVICADCSAAAIQTEVNAAGTTGTIIGVPAGTCNWDSDDVVAWENKDITITGTVNHGTIINLGGSPRAFNIYITNSSRGAVRIAGLKFTGSVTLSVIQTNSGALAAIPTGRWRFDHNDFTFTAGIGVFVTGPNMGVIDHNTFRWTGPKAIMLAQALGDPPECPGSQMAGAFINSQPLDYGGPDYVFIEDNTFLPSGTVSYTALDSSAGGGRSVFRYNTVTGGQIYNHWTRGCEFASQVSEIYNNHFEGDAFWGDGGSFADVGYFMDWGSGTQLIFNNQASNYRRGGVNPPYIILTDRRATGTSGSPDTGPPSTGECDGTKAWDGNAGDVAAPGWPCLGQIGRAPGQTHADLFGDVVEQASAPTYLWNNGETSGCRTGGACTDTLVFSGTTNYIKSTAHAINGEVDVVNSNTAKPGYTPYTYPHPLAT